MARKELRRSLSKWGAAGGLCGAFYMYYMKSGAYLNVDGILGVWLNYAFGAAIGASFFLCLGGIILAPKISAKIVYLAGILGCLGILTATDAYRLASSNKLELEPSSDFIVYVDNRSYWLSTKNPQQYDGTSNVDEVLAYYERSLVEHKRLNVVVLWSHHALERAEDEKHAESVAIKKANELAEKLEAISGDKPVVRER